MKKTTVNPINMVLNLSKKPNVDDFIYQELKMVDSYEIVNLILFENAIRCKKVQELVIKLYNYDIDNLFIKISNVKKNDENNVFITYLTDVYNKIMLVKKVIYSEFEESYSTKELLDLYFNANQKEFEKTKNLVDNLLESFKGINFIQKDSNNVLNNFEGLINLFDLDIKYLFDMIKKKTNNFTKLVEIDTEKLLSYSKMIEELKIKYKLNWDEVKKYLDIRIEYMKQAQQIKEDNLSTNEYKEKIKELVILYRKNIKNELANIYTKSSVNINLNLFSRPVVQLYL